MVDSAERPPMAAQVADVTLRRRKGGQARRSPALLVLVALLAVLGPTAAGLAPGSASADAPHPTPDALAALGAALRQDVAAQPPGSLSIAYRDLSSGQAITLMADQAWDPASVVKLFVMATAYHRRSEGTLDFQTPITVAAADVVPTAGFADGQYPSLYAGITVTVGTLVAMMIVQSDNTAYNTLLDLLGRRQVTAYARSLGLAHTTIARKLNLDGDAQAQDMVRAAGKENSTTVAEVARFYLLLYHDRVSFAPAMLHLLARQKQNYMLPAGLPPGTLMAHKPGEVDDTLRHDGGIAYLRGGAAFLLVVFSSLGSYAELIAIARQVAGAYPPAPRGAAPPGSLTAPPPGTLGGVLRLVLALVAAALLLLVAGLDRGIPGRRPRRRPGAQKTRRQRQVR